MQQKVSKSGEILVQTYRKIGEVLAILEDKNSDNIGNWTTNPPSHRKTASGQRGNNINIGLVLSYGNSAVTCNCPTLY